MAALRYYYLLPSGNLRMFPRSAADTSRFLILPWPVPMRATPSVTGSYGIEGGGSGAVVVEAANTAATAIYAAAGGTTQFVALTSLGADSDL
ncbi:MAG: hypothetical protein BGO82_17260 [Devosia sp. 67-54]|uniref:hypothetical protein n=1 Tax=unclassified Devosia TaxID=196773 RepID=UPI000968E397|nr:MULTISPECIES: hypothetical protein [unclassified Devosia]MBN9304125.1 hypothetical protein [Devosia sp.]OJX17957.1 MAG: hypothetical protein BGO82_17260 [Devosia sp. 67-54]